jgi:uncharacterized protein (TIGR02391 family)
MLDTKLLSSRISERRTAKTMTPKRSDIPPIEPREFKSIDELNLGIAKLERRLRELESLDVRNAILHSTGADDAAGSNFRASVGEVFGLNSPEFREHGSLSLWSGPMFMGMSDHEIVAGTERGKTVAIGILKGLIGRLREKREDLAVGSTPVPSGYFDHLKLHPRILDVSRDLFLDGYHWESVFAASKALVNYVKERSGRHDLDGAPLVRTVFSRNDPALAFNDLASQTDQDGQEGMMHLFEGAVLGIRNPGGHSFPEGPEQRAIEYLSLLSLLAYRVQEAKRRKGP